MRFERLLATLLTPLMILLNCPVMAAPTGDAQAAKPTTEIFHKQIENTEAGKRVVLYTEVSDTNGVDVVRIYFKSQEAADYNFVGLQATPNEEKSLFQSFKSLGSDFKGQGFSGVLPAPAKGSKGFEYLILVKNKANIVVKSQTYKVTVVEAQGEAVASNQPVKVYTELSETPTQVTGFSDNIAIDGVESGGKFGAVAGLYASVTTGGGGAVSGGTVAASAGEFTTTAVVVSSAAAVVVVGGLAAVAGGGGSGGGGGEALTSKTIVGAWNYTGNNPSYNCNASGTFTFNDNGTFNVHDHSICPTYDYGWRDAYGTWSLNGSNLSYTDNNGVTGSSTVSGNSNAFTATQNNGYTVKYSR
ncbi:MAG: lipocalin family protein [Pseudomonadota bacterium]